MGVFCQNLHAAESSTSSEKRAEALPELRILVMQLGHSSFSVRENAEHQLVKQGLKAKAALQEGLEHFDLEVRSRCRGIWATIETLDFEQRMQAFIDDVDGKREHQLPGWIRFREVVGQDRAAREMFVEMQKSEAALMQAAEESPKAAGEMFTTICTELQRRMFSQINFQDLTVGTTAALLFVGSDPRVQVTDQASMLMYSLVNQTQYRQVLAGGQQMPHAKKLLGQWVARRKSPQMAYQNMMLAMQHDLPEGLEPALSMVNDASVHASQRAYAVVAVAKLGSKEHIPALEKLLADASVCASYQTRDKRISTETRDVALAALVHITNQSLPDYGFNRVQSNPQTLFYPFSLGFQDTKQRDASIAKWKKWHSEQKPKP